jgi:hypothetical protein
MVLVWKFSGFSDDREVVEIRKISDRGGFLMGANLQ